MAKCGLKNSTWDNVWAAAVLAMLLKLMMLPMASALGELSLTQLLQGSFCSSGGPQYVAPDDNSTQASSGADKVHCLCSQSSGGMPPGLALRLPCPGAAVIAIAMARDGFFRLPRFLWPSLSPRASPIPAA